MAGEAPSWGSGTTAGATGTVATQMKSAVAQTAPLATQWNGQQQSFAQYTAPSSAYNTSAAGPSWVSSAVSKIESLGKESAHLTEGAGSWLMNQGKDFVEAVPRLAVNAYKLTDDAYNTYEYRNQQNSLTDQLQTLNQNFKQGKINHTQYSEALKGWVKDNQDLQDKMKGLTASIGDAGKNVTQSTITVASGVVAIMTGGGSEIADVGTKGAADFLMSDAGRSVTMDAEDLIAKLATNAKLMEGLSDTGAGGIKDSIYSVFFNGAKTQTAAGMSRAAAANLLFKYPLTFNMLSGTGNQVYKELQQEKYGDAIKTSAFNGAMLVSGGVIGRALEGSGAVLKTLAYKTFGEPTFIDTLSEALGKDSQKFIDAITDGGEDSMKNWRALEETNVSAEKGNIKSAVYRIVDSWRNAGRPIDQMSEKDIVDEANSWAENQRAVQQRLVQSGMSEKDAARVVIGRWSALDKKNIADSIENMGGRTYTKETTIPARTERTVDARELPTELSGAKPRYSYGSKQFSLNFKDGLTKALYIVAGKNPSSRDGDYLNYLKEHFPGKSTSELRSMGQDVRNSIKSIAKGSSESSIDVDTHPSVESLPKKVTTTKIPAKTVSTRSNTSSNAKADLLKAWEDIKAEHPNAAYSNNKSLDDEIKNIIRTSRSPSAAAKKIRAIESSFKIQGRAMAYLKGGRDATGKFLSNLAKKMEKDGYIPIEPANLEAPFKEGEGAIKTAADSSSDFFTRATQPVPVLAHIGSFLTSMGLSPIVATQRVQDLFTNQFTQVLAEKGLLGAKTDEDSDLVLKKLGNFMKQKTIKFGDREVSIVSDYRALSLKDISNALTVDKETARGVRSALEEAMIRVPVQVRGAGDRVMDWNYRLNPVARWYSKIQSATRFAWNPIFQARVSYKYEILSQLKMEGKPLTLLGTHNILSRIFPEYYNRLPEIDKILESNGVYGAGQAAEAADDEAVNYKYTKTAHTLLGSQRRTISSLVASMADRSGLSVKDFVKSFPEETRDAVRTITEYDPKGNFLNSPLTRTLNYAFFPFRFNVKVTTAIAKVMVKQPAMVQFALIKGMMQAHQFLNSKEGNAWYHQNADVIALAEYFTPLETLSTVASILQAPGDMMNYGELGGLPFGWISGLLESEGMIKTAPYVSPTTGQTLPDYIPADTRGRFAAAIEDLLGTLYTYPGSSLGLTSKGKIDENVADWFVPGHSTSDFNAITPTDLTPQQQQFQQVIQQSEGTNKNIQQSLKQQQQTNPSASVPSSGSGLTTGPGDKSGSTTSTKKKKGQYIPQLLPGQTQLGQIP